MGALRFPRTGSDQGVSGHVSGHVSSGRIPRLAIVDSSTLAIAFSVAGGVSELVGLAMVAREIRRDQRHARRLFRPQEAFHRPERNYPAQTRHGGANPRGHLGTPQPGQVEREMEAEIREIINALIGMRKAVDAERDDLEELAFEQIAKGDNALRHDLLEVLAGNTLERVVGATAIALGIALASVGAVLSSVH